MKNNSTYRSIYLFFLLSIVARPVMAGWLDPQVSRLQTSSGSAVAPYSLSDCSWSGTGVGICAVSASPCAAYSDKQVINTITLGVDHSITDLQLPTMLKVHISIYAHDVGSQAITDIPGTEPSSQTCSGVTEDLNNIVLTIYYDPTSATPYNDKVVFKFSGAYSFKFAITEIDEGPISGTTITSYPPTLADNFYVQGETDVERYYQFSTTNPPSNLSASINSDYCDGNVLTVSWDVVCGAEQYQLEYLYVNDYGPNGDWIDPAYDFTNNATRITTVNTSYDIPMLFDHGYLLFRARAIGVDYSTPDNIWFGEWTTDLNGNVTGSSASGFSCNYHVATAHEGELNWQTTSTFAEEGKRKDIINYADGSLRKRQTVTKVNTDNTIIAGETIYDYNGRPAVTVLPTPVNESSCTLSSIQFYPNLNCTSTSNTAVEFSKTNFDEDAGSAYDCGLPPLNAGMNTSWGASNYYSPLNPNLEWHQKYLPDAQLYPFSQIEYTPDNTGRIRRQGGVGLDFQLGTNHETKYWYGQPNQIQLDRLFGSEAGDASHYKENLVVDPNLQISCSYLDMQGKVVATSLVGDKPGNLNPINSYTGSGSNFYVDLFNANANGQSQSNAINASGDGIEFSTQFLAVTPSDAYEPYTFEYKLDVPSYTEECFPANVCFSCVYNLVVSITDECGNAVEVTPVGSTPSGYPVIGHFSYVDDAVQFVTDCPTCTGVTGSSFHSDIKFSTSLHTGNYTITKKLMLDNDAVNFYASKYTDPAFSSCVAQTQQDFINAENNYNQHSNCNISCAECVQSLGNRDDFVAQGRGTAMQYDQLMESCQAPCKKSSLCEADYQAMLEDMLPGGQYAEYLDGQTGEENVYEFPLSIFNPTGELPNNSSLIYTYWQNPQININGNTYNNYLDENGQPSEVPVLLRDGVFFSSAMSTDFTPNVDLQASVIYDAVTQTYYVYPNHLANVNDFINFYIENPGWAKSLVCYHPEYPYYQACVGFSKEQNALPDITSNTFDNLLQSTTTFAAAELNGLLLNNGNGHATVYNSSNHNSWFIQQGTDAPPFNNSTNLPYDDFCTTNTALGQEIKNDFSNYVGSGNDMEQSAALSVICGNSPNSPIITVTQLNNATCGQNNGAVGITVSAGLAPYAYSWSNSQTASTIPNLAAGIYTVTVTDVNGSSATQSIAVNSNDGPVITANLVNASNSYSTGAVSLSVSGGAVPYTYSWNTTATSSNLTQLTPGSTYVVTVTDAQHISTEMSVTPGNNLPTATTLGATIISSAGSNGSIALTVSGGVPPFTYSWTNTPSTAKASEVDELPSGSYTVSVTDQANNATTQTFTVPATSTLGSYITELNDNNNSSTGSISVTASGGTPPYTYTWSNTATTSEIDGLPANNSPGYTVSITDASNNITSLTIPVSNNVTTPALSAAIMNTTYGSSVGAISISVSGGVVPYIYSWSGVTASSSTVNNLPRGTYTVTVTDANGSSSSLTTNIGIASNTGPALAASVVNIGASSPTGSVAVTLMDGISGNSYTYNWSNTMSSSSISGLATGTYSVTATYTGNVCPVYSVSTVTEPCTASFGDLSLQNTPEGVETLNAEWNRLVYLYETEKSYVKNQNDMSSDEFDDLLYNTDTYNDAVNYGLIPSSNTFSSSGFNWFGVGTGQPPHPTDGFVTEGFSGGSSFKDQFFNYQSYNGQNYSMVEIAALLVLCGGVLPPTPESNSCYTGFGTGSTAQLDDEWKSLKGMYLQAKYGWQKAYLDNSVGGQTNNCIGWADEQPTPNYFPCAITAQDYGHKKKRFTDVSDMNNLAPANPGYQVYLQTGQCPVAFALEQMLNGVLNTQQLGSTIQYLEQNPSYIGLLAAINGGGIYNQPPPVERTWVGSFTGYNTSLSVTMTGSNGIPDYTLTLGGGTRDISTYSTFRNLTCTSTGNGPTFTFTVDADFTAAVPNTNPQQYQASTDVLSGTVNFDICNCNFANDCRPNNLANDIVLIMSGMLYHGQFLSSTAVDLTANGSYSPYLTKEVLNELAPSGHVDWKYNSGSSFYIYDNTSSSSIQLNILNVAPAPNSGFSLSNPISSTDRIINLHANSTNIFTIDIDDNTSNKLATIQLQAEICNSSGCSDIVMGSCQLATPVNCQGPEYRTANDLQNLLNQVFASYPTTSIVELTQLSGYTKLLQSYIPSIVGEANNADGLYSFDDDYQQTTNGLHFHDDISFSDPLSVGFTNYTALKLWHDDYNDVNTSPNLPHFDMGSLVSVSNLNPEGTPDGNGNYYNFYATASYYIGSYNYTGIIHGNSQWPLKICDACPELNQQSSGTAQTFSGIQPVYSCLLNPSNTLSIYNNYASALNALVSSYPSALSSIAPVSYAEYQNHGYATFNTPYINFIQNFIPGIDNIAYLQHPDQYMTDYGVATNVDREYTRYATAINAYNVKATYNSTQLLTPVVNTEFAIYNYASANSQYVSYLNSLSAYGSQIAVSLPAFVVQTPVNSGNLINPANELCFQQYYTSYVNAYYSFKNNYPAIYCQDLKLYDFDYFYSMNYCCSSAGQSLITNYINSLLTGSCPGDLTYYNYCSVSDNCNVTATTYCNNIYTNYENNINAYNSSLYASSTGNSMTNDLPSFADVTNCDCVAGYNVYLNFWTKLTAPISSSTPNSVYFDSLICAPLSYTDFVNQGYCSCFSETQFQTDIQNYVTEILAYDNSVASCSIPKPLPINPYQLLCSPVSACSCLSTYNSYFTDWVTTNNSNLCSSTPTTFSEYIVSSSCSGTITSSTTTTVAPTTYNNYVQAVVNYNSQVFNFNSSNSSPQLPYILNPPGKQLLTIPGLGDVVNDYTHFLNNISQVIANPTGSNPLAGLNMTLVNLAVKINIYSWGTGTPPCKSSTNPFDNMPNRITTAIADPCQAGLNENANANAAYEWTQYTQQLIAKFTKGYRQHCLQALEHFFVNYEDYEYHFTLYYYDQAGNLVKTVPPQGVEPLDLTSSNGPNLIETLLNADRTNGTQHVFTTHKMATKYEYNSLNQLTKQTLPDQDNMNVWETTLPNGLDSRLVVTQSIFPTEKKGYLCGYINVATNINRGYVYQSNDGGKTWQQEGGEVAADLHKVQMADANNAFAVGNDGVVMQSSDAGKTWDMLNSYGADMTEGTTVPVTSSLNDLYFTGSGGNYNGIVVGDNGLIWLVTYNGSPLSYHFKEMNTATGSPPITISDNITSIVTDGSSIFITVNSTTNNNGRVYKSDVSPSNISLASLWTIDNSMRTTVSLNAVKYSGTSVYACGNDGNLLVKSQNPGSWQMLSTGTAGHFRNVFFKPDNKGIGVAIIENDVPLDNTYPAKPGVMAVGQLMYTTDGGNTWNLFKNTVGSAVKPTDYNTLYAYDPANGKVLAAGKNGVVTRVILKDANSCAADNYNTNIPYTTSGGSFNGLNISAIWGKIENNGNLAIVMAGVQGSTVELAYTSEGNVSFPEWYFPPTTCYTYGNQPIKMVDKLETTSNQGEYYETLLGQGNDGTGSFISLHYTPVAGLVVTATKFSDINNIGGLAYDATNNYFFFYDNYYHKIHFLQFDHTTVSGSMNYTGTINQTDFTESYMSDMDVVAGSGPSSDQIEGVSQEGNLYNAAISYSSGAPSSYSYTNETDNVQSVPLYGRTYSNGTNSDAGYKRFYVCGENGRILQRDPTANEWRILQTGTADKLNAICFGPDNTTGFAVGEGGGAYWFKVNNANDYYLLQQNTNYFLTSISTGVPGDLMDVQTNGNYVYACGQNGSVLFASNSAALATNSFGKCAAASSQTMYSVFFPSSISNTIEACGGSGFMGYFNSTGSAQNINLYVPAIRSIHFRDGYTGLIAADNFAIRTTTNGGKTWNVVLPDGKMPLGSSMPQLNRVYARQQTTLGVPVIAALVTNATVGTATGAIGVSASGGKAPYAYTWSNSSTGNNISSLLASGSPYFVTVTDANGITASISVTVGSNPSTGLTLKTSVVNPTTYSSTGSATVTASSGVYPYTYSWSDFETTRTISNLPPRGSYTVTVTDANNNTGSAGVSLVNVTVNDPLAIVMGGSSYIALVDFNTNIATTVNNNLTGSNAVNNITTSTNVSFNAIDFSNPALGWLVGTDQSLTSGVAYKVVSDVNNNYSWSGISGFSGYAGFNTVKAFERIGTPMGGSPQIMEFFISGGDGGGAMNYDNYRNEYTDVSLSGSDKITDVFFHDDVNGYFCTDDGKVFRSSGSVNSNGTVDISWADISTGGQSVADGQNSQGTAADLHLYTIQFPTRYHGFVGGQYIASGVQVNYARDVHDESGYYSAFFYYDKLGRIVVSQNTRQHNNIYNSGATGVVPVNLVYNAALMYSNANSSAEASIANINSMLPAQYQLNTSLTLSQLYTACNFTYSSGAYSLQSTYNQDAVLNSNGTGSVEPSHPLYSYTRYDPLGRVVEAGEKFENTSTVGGLNGPRFNSIFGSNVGTGTDYDPEVIDNNKLQSWLTCSVGGKQYVTQTVYDNYNATPAPYNDFVTNDPLLRKRVAQVYTYDGPYVAGQYTSATDYKYDIHGNVSSLVQDYNYSDLEGFTLGTNEVSQEFKRLDYQYDLISGNVNQVSYQAAAGGQAAQPDQWYHQYVYDADNRITEVRTSTDGLIWDEDGKYFYYKHGALARTEIGGLECSGTSGQLPGGNGVVQGMDYAYTLQGWLKSMNSDALTATADAGQDGNNVTGNANAMVATDAAGFSLNYYMPGGSYTVAGTGTPAVSRGDYIPIGYEGLTPTITTLQTASLANSDVIAARNDLWNGNIGQMTTTLQDPNAAGTVYPLGMAYQYDQLNRITNAEGFTNLSSNAWQQGSSYAGQYLNQFSYDENGNILTQVRNAYNGTSGGRIQNLTYDYHYNVDPATSAHYTVKNRLYSLEQNSSNVNAEPNQIVGQGAIQEDGTQSDAYVNANNNYGYDAEGRLIRDNAEEIANITWTVAGKVKSIIRTSGSTKKNLVFLYDPMGNRIGKEVYTSGDTWLYTEYYVHDAQGNIMAVYTNNYNSGLGTTSFSVTERDIYGSRRMGVNNTPVEMISSAVYSSNYSYSHFIGNKDYELDNHLGNVLATITDKKIPIYSSNVFQYYAPQILNTYDYSPFGAPLSDRSLTLSGYTASYRFGFNGHEKDDEIYGQGDAMSAENWEYDTRLGRRWNIDPKFKSFANQSTYATFNCNPLLYKDPKGSSGEVSITTDDKGNPTIVITSNLILYGSGASAELAKSTAQNIQDAWNAANGKVMIDGVEYSVQFVIVPVYKPDCTQEELDKNTDIKNNYYRVEDETNSSEGGASYTDASPGEGANSGYFKKSELEDGSKTESHEYGHSDGEVAPEDGGDKKGHPLWNNATGQGQPGIMYPKGSFVDPQYQIDPKAAQGAKGGVLDASKRKVTQRDINNLHLDKLHYDKKGKANLGKTTNVYHGKAQ